VANFIRAYQVNGHRLANLDPLGLHANELFPSRPGNARSKSDLDGEEGLAEALTVGFRGLVYQR
jgi:2-oxoglutarate dehydrogenase complex dehydrogenase (E1) component-like enzyme